MSETDPEKEALNPVLPNAYWSWVSHTRSVPLSFVSKEKKKIC